MVHRSNPSVEASEGKGVSRNTCEPDSASKRYLQVAKLPKMTKPATDGTATSVSPSDLPGWLGAARAERPVEEPGRAGMWVEPNAIGKT